MIFGFGIMATALLLSAVAAYYSVAGLTAIFAAATIPVIIMGGSLELGKIVATVWLHNNWRRAGLAFKLYLIPAITFLMLLTSMGIFGYLSKAHSDQSLVSGDVQAKIAIYDEKIRTEKDNIDASRKAIKQLDEAVDQVMGRSTDERGAERSVQIRRSQQAERGRLFKEIEQSQKKIAALNEERAPIAAEIRKVEAEVGPIKYIAALIYGDNPDANLLERAVRWMIIMIVLVFDPLALTLILAANKQFEWARQGRGGWAHDDPQYPADNGALSNEQFDQLKQNLDLKPTVTEAPDTKQDTPPEAQMNQPQHLSVFEKYPYLAKPFVHFSNLKPMVWRKDIVTTPNSAKEDDDDIEDSPEIKAAKTLWKSANPDKTLKEERRRFQRGEISQLPWMKLVADNQLGTASQTGFGTAFPDHPVKGHVFVRVDTMPNRVYKFNGSDWINVDKTISDQYTMDTAYIDHLIEKIEQGQYDPELLTEREQEQIANRIKQTGQ